MFETWHRPIKLGWKHTFQIVILSDIHQSMADLPDSWRQRFQADAIHAVQLR